MKLSIEISNYNRKEVLYMALQRLARQTYPADQFEVVISDDGSTDGAMEFIEKVKGSFPFEVRLLRSGRRGCGLTHNAGILESRGGIVMMLANDILAEPNLVEEHMKVHEANPQANVVVVGKLRQSKELEQTVFQRCWDPITGRDPEAKTGPLGYTDFWVSNISFKKDFMVENGMFRDWPAGAHEDLELGYRLERKGMKLIFNINALGYHYHAETIETVEARAYMHGFNWHYIEKNIGDPWIKSKSGRIRPGDGAGAYMRSKCRHAIRKLLVNAVTVHGIARPLIKKAEDFPWLAFCVPFLTAKVSSFYFHKGYNDNLKKTG